MDKTRLERHKSKCQDGKDEGVIVIKGKRAGKQPSEGLAGESSQKDTGHDMFSGPKAHSNPLVADESD